MRGIKFTKMEGAGNDFVVIEGPCPAVVGRPSSVVKICDRIFGIGADGLLLLEKSGKADIRMRIFNADGSEAQMCGNGARCCALWASRTSAAGGSAFGGKNSKLRIETKAGIVDARVEGDSAKIKLTDPVDLKLDIHMKVDGKDYEVDYVNTGVPHAVIEVDDIEMVSVKKIGRLVRHHKIFQPAGTNVDFVQVKDRDHVVVRTYERGVEDETLACGTGSVASAIIAVLNHFRRDPGQGKPDSVHKIFVETRSRETLKVYFRFLKKKISDVWLEGKARMVFKGEYYV
jgi:diaminopimelate epimerase